MADMPTAYDRLPLGALRVFEAVATHLSFSAAADALSVTPAAVSQQIKALEGYIQVPLFRRNGRQWLNRPWLVSAIFASSTMKCLLASRIGFSCSHLPKNGKAPQLLA